MFLFLKWPAAQNNLNSMHFLSQYGGINSFLKLVLKK